MKKQAFTATLLSTLLITALAGILFVNLVNANPGLWLLGFPRDPVKTPPEIIFQSPMNNQTYDPNFLWLNFTIVKPESWFLVANANYISPNNYIYVNITSVSYTIDGITSERMPLHDVTDLLVEQSPSRSLDFSTNLSLPEGAHNLTVSIQCDSYYWGSDNTLPSNIQINFSSEVVYFTIANAEPFPATLVVASVASLVAVVSVGLLVYFKKKGRAP